MAQDHTLCAKWWGFLRQHAAHGALQQPAVPHRFAHPYPRTDGGADHSSNCRTDTWPQTAAPTQARHLQPFADAHAHTHGSATNAHAYTHAANVRTDSANGLAHGRAHNCAHGCANRRTDVKKTIV